MPLRISKKTNNIVAIFAHPDDESFGPAGTIAKLARKNDLYLICATKGEAGKGDPQKLGETRAAELLESAKLLGIKKVFFLDFIDGTLSNSIYHRIAGQIENIIKKIKPSTIITYEPRGISGHIDHITVSMVCSYLFERLSYVDKILYYCIDQKNRSKFGSDYFIYFPPGYKKSEIDMIVPVADVWDLKVEAMMLHKSQRHDAQRILQRRSGLPKEECFLVGKK